MAQRTMPEAVVRRAAPGDAAGVRRVACLAWEAAYRDILSPAEREASLRTFYGPEILRRRMEAGPFLVAEWGGEVVAFADFVVPSERSGAVELAALYVLPGMQRRGIGTRLVEAGIALHPHGSPVELRVLRGNAAGRRFYEALGFRPRPEDAFEGGGAADDEVGMVFEPGGRA